MSHSTSLLRIEQLQKSFARAARPVFSDVNLTLDASQQVAVVGSNGCGKTTLLRCVAGLIPIDAGSIVVAGERVELRGRRARRHLSFVPDDHPIRLKITAREYLQLVARANGSTHAEAEERARECLALLGLEAQSKAYLESCSHGVTKRIGLAAALAARPRLLVLDEPESGLDPASLVLLDQILERHREAGGAVLVATHRPRWAAEQCDHVWRLTPDGLVDGVESPTAAANA